jgi:hypothetical protein
MPVYHVTVEVTGGKTTIIQVHAQDGEEATQQVYLQEFLPKGFRVRDVHTGPPGAYGG